MTCPTGIDIRDGLQMECIHCTQCMDACDAMMDQVGRPRGLIRYSSKEELSGHGRRVLRRPRVVLYPVLLILVWGALALALAERQPADVTVLRGLGSPWSVVPSGEVSNQIRIKIANRRNQDQRYTIALVDEPRLGLVVPENPLPVAAGRSATATVFVTAPPAMFDGGRRDIQFRVSDAAGFSMAMPYRLLGPGSEGDNRLRSGEKQHE
jgi:polyferredoxin